jgi:integrase
VIDQARQRRVLGLYVVADDKGRQITKGRMERAWQAARAAAGVEDIQFRDIRAKSATEAQRRGQDHQKLLGHTTQRQSDAYVRSRRVEQVEPLKGKL